MKHTARPLLLALGAFAALSACSGGNDGDERRPDTAASSASPRTADSAGGTAAMPGMDHSKMPMGPATRGSRSASAPAAMAGMDHSTMNMPAATRGTTTSPAPRSAASMAGMDHSTMVMPGGVQQVPPMPMPVAADSATLKLQRLVARLVEDPVVRRRIQADSLLRNRWQDPQVREVILP